MVLGKQNPKPITMTFKGGVDDNRSTDIQRPSSNIIAIGISAGPARSEQTFDEDNHLVSLDIVVDEGPGSSWQALRSWNRALDIKEMRKIAGPPPNISYGQGMIDVITNAYHDA